MTLKQKYGSTALVAGASEGIGAAFATRLAGEGIDLVLIARRSEPLQQLADLLENKFNVDVMCIQCNLGDIDAARQIEKELNGREINMLVYNAAESYIGPFVKNPLENHVQAAHVNMLTPLKMVYLFGEKMLAKGKGAIILMASLAAFQGSGNISVYSATKAFNRVLGESLWYEWKNSGVDVIACCAGSTSTPGFNNTHPEKASFFAPRVQAPEEVADDCFNMLGRQPSYITGIENRIASFIMQKILPRKMAIKIMGDNIRKMYRL